MSERYDIATAPRDGTVLIVGADDVGEFPMRWDEDRVNPLVANYPGIWVISDGSMTWHDHPEFGPAYWRHP